jgi:diguanylate cyclase (GGDEF)-like protein/PAS domain S-box-containing protein
MGGLTPVSPRQAAAVGAGSNLLSVLGTQGWNAARALLSLQSLREAVVVVDLNGALQYLNPAAEMLTGWRNDEASGKAVAEVLCLVEEPTDDTALHPVLRPLRPGSHGSTPENYRLKHRAGVEVAVRFSVAPMFSGGAVAGAVALCRDVTHEHHLARSLAYQARHDALTGLINRREFDRRLEQALGNAQDGDTSHALLFIDLDQFKTVNDACGHAAGDRLLREVTALLHQQVRNGDCIARLGGDEFGVIAQDCPEEQAVKVADAIRRAVHEYSFNWQEKVFRIGASIGIAGINGSTDTVASLVGAADKACYAAKAAGRNRVHVHRDGLLQAEASDMYWVGRVTRAVEHGHLELLQQPITTTGDAINRMQFHELLVRMRGESESLVLPGDFVPAAERYNLITAIDSWVLRRAAGLVHERLAQGLPPTMLLAVNVSTASLTDRGYLDLIQELTKDRTIASGLCFEVSESSVQGHLIQVQHFIDYVKGRGCRVTLDDFGSVGANMQLLRALHLDFLKIHQDCTLNIVNDPIDRSLVEGVINLARTLRIATIAECIETGPVHGMLVKLGVDYVQGYEIAMPQSLETLGQMPNLNPES